MEIKDIRATTGLNRKEFCDRFGIPYRTVTDWEAGKRNAPEYVKRLIAYYVKCEGLCKEHDKS